MNKLLPSVVASTALAFGILILWWQGAAYEDAGRTLSDMVKDHQTLIGSVIALCAASLGYLAATASLRAQVESRRTAQSEHFEALRSEVAFRMFRVFAGVKGWYDAAIEATNIDYETRLQGILRAMPPILDSATSVIHQAWREIGTLSVNDQRAYRKFLGEAELLVDAYRTSIYGLNAFTGKEAAYYELGWPRIMASFKNHTDDAWNKSHRVQDAVKQFSE